MLSYTILRTLDLLYKTHTECFNRIHYTGPLYVILLVLELQTIFDLFAFGIHLHGIYVKITFFGASRPDYTD